MTQERCQCVFVCWRVAVLLDITMDTKLSKSPAGSQQSAQPCNALSSTFNNRSPHIQHMHTRGDLLSLYIPTPKHTPANAVDIFTIKRHRQLRHHYSNAFTAYFVCPITVQLSFVLPLFCRACYSTKRKEIATQLMGDSFRFSATCNINVCT